MRHRVLHVIYSLYHGGAERVIETAHLGGDRRRFEYLVCSITGGGDMIDRMSNAGSRVFLLGKRRRGDVTAVTKLANLIRREKVDLLHLHNSPGMFWGTLAQIASATGVPIVRTEHNPYLPRRCPALPAALPAIHETREQGHLRLRARPAIVRGAFPALADTHGDPERHPDAGLREAPAAGRMPGAVQAAPRGQAHRHGRPHGSGQEPQAAHRGALPRASDGERRAPRDHRRRGAAREPRRVRGGSRRERVRLAREGDPEDRLFLRGDRHLLPVVGFRGDAAHAPRGARLGRARRIDRGRRNSRSDRERQDRLPRAEGLGGVSRKAHRRAPAGSRRRRPSSRSTAARWCTSASPRRRWSRPTEAVYEEVLAKAASKR